MSLQIEGVLKTLVSDWLKYDTKEAMPRTIRWAEPPVLESLSWWMTDFKTSKGVR